MLGCPACSSQRVGIRLFKYQDKTRRLLQCGDCGHAYDEDFLRSNQGYAQGEYGLVDGKIPLFDRDLRLARTLIASQFINPGDHVLDFGAGWGGLSLRISQLSKEYSLGIRMSCYEPVRRLGDYIKERDPSIVVHEEVDSCTGYNFVIAKEVIEHSNNPKLLLEGLAKTMNDGACILLTCPGHTAALGENPGNAVDYQDRNHLHFFTRKSLEALVARTELFDIKTIALLDQYPGFSGVDWSDQEKSESILRALSYRWGSEPDHLQVLLRLK